MQFPTLECIAHGAGNRWEAICLDLDISVQGTSLNEVTRSLEESVVSYIKDACAEDAATTATMLARGVPFRVRMYWALKLFFATMTGKRLGRGIKAGDQEPITIGFPVECPA